MAAKKKKNNDNLFNNPAAAVIVIGAVMLIVAVVLLVTQGRANSNAAQTAASPSMDIPYPNVTRVSLEDAKTAFDQGKAVFLDTRSAASFEAVHVSGAVSIPITELESRMNELKKDQWIIPYCT